MQTISGLGTCSFGVITLHEVELNALWNTTVYHTIGYTYIVQGQYFIQANINFASLYQHKICGQTRNSMRHDFILLHHHFLDQTVKLKIFPLAMSSFSRTLQMYFWNNACMRVCWASREQLGHFRTHLDFWPVWTTHKVPCLTLTQEDELIDWYVVSSLFKTVWSGLS